MKEKFQALRDDLAKQEHMPADEKANFNAVLDIGEAVFDRLDRIALSREKIANSPATGNAPLGAPETISGKTD